MRFALLIISSFLLCSCSNNSDESNIGPSIYGRSLLKNVNYDVYEGAHDADQELVDAAHQVSKSLDDLARIEYSNSKVKRIKDQTNADKLGMSDLGTIDWSGPVEPILKQLAMASHYKLRVLGNRPAIPVLINVNKSNASVAEIVRDITYQVHKQATIQIYPKSHTIELRYHKV